MMLHWVHETSIVLVVWSYESVQRSNTCAVGEKNFSKQTNEAYTLKVRFTLNLLPIVSSQHVTRCSRLLGAINRHQSAY